MASDGRKASTGVRTLNVLSEFKPFGLTVEALDGELHDEDDHLRSSSSRSEKYDYFLFDPEVTWDRRNSAEYDAVSLSCGGGDNEIFIRGNQIIWSAGYRVHKRYNTSSPIIKVSWCRIPTLTDPVLCALQVDALTVYQPSGEVISIPLAYSISSIWSLPCGLLLQRDTDGLHPSYLPFSTSSPLSQRMRDLSRKGCEKAPSPQYNHKSHNYGGCNAVSEFSTMASHFILKHPCEEPQAAVVEEKGKSSIMKDVDECIIWTSEALPLAVSHHKGKMMHSVWRIDVVDFNFESLDAVNKSHTLLPANFSERFCFRRIWHGKKSHSLASKVFLANDDDGVAIVCFLFAEQQCLFSLRLQNSKKHDGIVDEIKPEMTWSIPAIAAAPIVVTRQRSNTKRLQFADILVLSETNLLLYSGRQCLCMYMLPDVASRSISPDKFMPIGPNTLLSDFKVVGLADSVTGRVNIVLQNGQLFRCDFQQNPSSSLVADCIAALAEGMHPSFYTQFTLMLWGDTDTGSLSVLQCNVDPLWVSFRSVILGMCKKLGYKDKEDLLAAPPSSWEFLIGSKYHTKYCKSTIQNLPALASVDISCNIQSSMTPCFQERREATFCVQFLTEALDSLHAVYESYKLNKLRRWEMRQLVNVLCAMALSLGEANYLDHYVRDFPGLLMEIGPSKLVPSSRNPPSMFKWLQACVNSGPKSTSADDLPLLFHAPGDDSMGFARKVVSFYCLLFSDEESRGMISSLVSCNIAEGSASRSEELVVLAMVAEKFGMVQMDLLPVGVALPLCHALDKCREMPPVDWPAEAYMLIGREDLGLTYRHCSGRRRHQLSLPDKNLIAFTSPYVLQVRAVTTPSTSEIHELGGLKTDADKSLTNAPDGMDDIFNSSTQLRFGRDLRLNEVRHLLSSSKPMTVKISSNPSSSEQDQQQAQLWQQAQCTTTLPFGRGAFTLATTVAFLTEALIVPELVLSGRLPSQHNATVNLDQSVRNISQLRSWPEFHNGVAAGLKLAPCQGKISRTWIAYNKPQDLNATHAGQLFALGLHGHLRVLTTADVYQYLSQQHDMITVGILLGMAATYRGTMDPAVSKMFNLHIPSRLPSVFPELELPTHLQSAALLSLGLLYEGTSHPPTMSILLGEIGRRTPSDNVLEREGYAVAAGLALGLVSLGRGNDTFGIVDSTVDRLFQYIFGHEEASANISEDAYQTTRQNVSGGGTSINVDITSPGATISLALMFLKTESEVVASRLSIPQSHYDIRYVRPDILMLRVIARNLIMWTSICPSQTWIDSQIPEVVRCGLANLSREAESDEIDVKALVMAYVNIVAGACISLGLKYAGSRNADAQELLHGYALYFLNEIKRLSARSGPSGNTYSKGLAKHVDRGTLEVCLHVCVLSLSVVMAGSGHLKTLRLLKYLRGRRTMDGQANYGMQMTVSMAIGFIFLSGGMCTFSTGSDAIASLLIALYPKFPTAPHDSLCHLQAFRHFYVLATEARCVRTIDVDTGLMVYVPLEVTIRETDHHAETRYCEFTPCILPERATLKSVRICGPRYWPQEIELLPEDKPRWNVDDKQDLFSGRLVYVKRKVGACSYVDDPVGCQSFLSRVIHKVFDKPERKLSEARHDLSIRPGPVTADQLVSTFTANPCLISFARLCSDHAWSCRADSDFREFCAQVLYECVGKDVPALLQAYISLYTTIISMTDVATGHGIFFEDTLFLSDMKVALAYNKVLDQRSSLSNGVLQPMFLESLGKRVEEILTKCPGIYADFRKYLVEGTWPYEPSGRVASSLLLSWYLQWFDVPSFSVLKSTIEYIKAKPMMPSLPLLHFCLPRTHLSALGSIEKLMFPVSP